MNDPNSPAYSDWYNGLPASTRVYAHAPGSAGANQVYQDTLAQQKAPPGTYASFNDPPAAAGNPLGRTTTPAAPAAPTTPPPNPLARPAAPANPLARPAAAPPPLGAPATPPPSNGIPSADGPAPAVSGEPSVTTTTGGPLTVPPPPPPSIPTPKVGAAAMPGTNVFAPHSGFRVSDAYSPGSPTDQVTNAFMRRYPRGAY